ncbi:hypothetical protein Vretimale_866 [Volvox reticuliferus]|uniref:Uncharacterized protein n=1 Tax=Volvox reticuliferus TaxID=1737510 RepID=A0A8J4FYQ4_9CHLO|nr:hypothetical protein Vretifemale_2232 [Volvox reticuliferus]GIL94619.1 hypothetical protein Vretimale_866 [Volvox reticuliferus]
MARVRQGAPVLYVAAFLASILTQSATALYFENYVKWANQAIKGGPTEANCSLAAVDFLDFVYAIIESAAPTVGTAQLTQACISCASAVDASLTYLPASDPGVCPLLPYADVAKLTATALRRFVCFGDGGVDGGSSPAAGSCVVQVVDAIRKVGLLDRIRRLDPTLRFSGHMLEEVCSAMWRAPPAPASCCGRSWSYLMAAITQQSCLPDLSQEYASLPGRCEVLLNRSGTAGRTQQHGTESARSGFRT